MPPVAKHLKTSRERTGNEYRELHEWLDNDPEKKAERHDITKIYEYGRMIEEKYGKEGLQEYIQHDIEKAVADTLAYFGIK